jgi:hypothetical protein
MTMTELKVTSLDYHINRFNNKPNDTIIDLNTLATRFKLSDNFTKLEYSQKVGKNSIEQVINRPPVGPIPENYMCPYCERYGPNNHTVQCINPSLRSLVLTYGGFQQLLFDADYTGPLEEDLTMYRQNINREAILAKYFVDTTDLSNDSFSNITYDKVVKIKGKDPKAPKTIATRFSNVVFLYYSYDDATASLRIYRDGMVDIKNAPRDERRYQELLNTLSQKINDSGAVATTAYSRLLSFNGLPPSTKWSPLIVDLYVVHAMAYLFGEEDRKTKGIVFDRLEDILLPMESNNYVTVRDTQRILLSLPYNVSVKNKTSDRDNMVFLFTNEEFTVSIFVTRYGVFQYTLSGKDLSPNQTIAKLNAINTFFINVFNSEDLTEPTYISTNPLIYAMHETQDATVTGLIPPKSKTQREGTEVCRKTQSGVAMQPTPYTWTGTCADENYAPTMGLSSKSQGGDVKVSYRGREEQLYYPCCVKLVGKAKIDYIDKLKRGITVEEQATYGVFPDDDILSGVIDPRSTKVGEETFVRLPNETDYSRVRVITAPKKVTADALYQVQRLSDNQLFTVTRMSFKRASRYFRGLNSLSKEELIAILRRENLVIDGQTVRNFRQPYDVRYITYDALLTFNNKKYSVTSVPHGAYLVYLKYINKNNQFFVEPTNMIKLPSEITFIENTTTLGYYLNSDFYPIVVAGSGSEENSTDLLNGMEGAEEVEFYDNYVDASNYLLKRDPYAQLIFVPADLTDIIYVYDERHRTPFVNVQVLQQSGNLYTLGINNKPLGDFKLKIPQPPPAIVSVKGRYNKITNEIDNNRPLQYIGVASQTSTMLQWMDLTTPIDDSFFTQMEGESWIIDSVVYRYDENDGFLVPDGV